MIRLQPRILSGLLAAVVFVVGSTCVCALPTAATNFNADESRCCSGRLPESPVPTEHQPHYACQHCQAAAAVQRVEFMVAPAPAAVLEPAPPPLRPEAQAAMPQHHPRGRHTENDIATLLTLRCALNL